MPSLLDLLQARNDPTPFLHQALRDTYGEPEDAFLWLKMQRDQDPRNLALRNAEHALFGQVLKQDSPTMPLLAPAGILGYSGLKGLMQHGMPSSWANWLSQALQRQFGGIVPSPQSTPASLEELLWSLAPYWGGLPDLTPYRAQVP